MQPDLVLPVEPRVIGRYALYDEIASGGMATVHLGRLLGSAGFSRTVAIKRLHPNYAKDADFVSMFVDEARLAARIHHPNVVATLDVVSLDDELFLVMEYVVGESLGRLIPLARSRGERIPPAFAATIMAGVLHGLHAAHEARDELGAPLGIVHRDVSPQNVIVGVDGTARVLDFGVAKAAGRLQITREGQLKGKIAYMAPEQIQGITDRTTDVYSASVVLWETLACKRLFQSDSEVEAMRKVLDGHVEPLSKYAPDVPPALEAIILRGLDRDPARRFPTAGEMALALEDAMPMVAASKIGRWVQQTASQRLAERVERLASMESNSSIHGPASLSQRAAGSSSGSVAVSGVVSAPQLEAAALPPPVQRFPAPLPAPARKGVTVGVAVGILLLTVAGAVAVTLVVMGRHNRGAHVVTMPAATASIAPLAADSAVATPPLATAPPEASVATISVNELPAAEPLPSAAPAKPAVPSFPVGPAPRHPPTVPHAAAPDCNPPYYFNAQGDRIFKKDCL